MSWNGVYVATVTPFAKSGEVDFRALEKILLRCDSAGVDGFVACGTTGEAATLTSLEWEKIVEATAQFGKSKNKKTMAGCGSYSTKAVIEKISRAKALGSDAALVVTPYYNKPTSEGLLAHFQTIADQSELPIFLYNVPGRTNVNLSPEVTLQLLKHPQIVGIKEACPSHSQWVELTSQFPTDKSFFAGDDDMFATALALGGKGIISASANVLPEWFVRIYRAGKAGNYTEAFQTQKRIFALVKSLFSETNPSPVKFALEQLGLCENSVRLPLVCIKENTRKSVLQELKALELLP
jgi:4-hydroxy-tetrahydrodipicolinate synthase